MILRSSLKLRRGLSPPQFLTSLSQLRNPSTESFAKFPNPSEYCKDLVKKQDYESYLISGFYPKKKQAAYFALKAFSVELATIQDNVTNTVMGQMRMQFWRDAIKGISDGKPPHHPIAMALYDASQSSHIPGYHLKRIVDARDAELETPTHNTVASLTTHAEATSSTMLYLLLSLLSNSSSTASHAASHLGVAQTFTTLLRALPFHAHKGQMVIPAEITAKHKVKQDDVFRKGPEANGIGDAVFEFATIANDNLLTAQEMFKDGVPREIMPVFLAGVPVSRFLRRLEKANFDVFEQGLQVRDWRLAWDVWRGYHKGKFC